MTCVSGSVCNFMRQFSKAVQGDVERIGNDVAASSLIGSDATFTRSEGHQTYVYVYHNAKDSVVYAAEEKKGHAALAGSPVEAAADATIVHDHSSQEASGQRKTASSRTATSSR